MAQPTRPSMFSGGGPALYQRTLAGPLFTAWAEELLAEAVPSRAERVLDVACGTGVVTRLVAERVESAGRVVGLDLSPDMLAVARSLSAPWIEWCESSATSLPLPDGAFDLVLCQQGLQFFPDRPAALREMQRVLTPGGRVAVSVFCSSVGHDVLFSAATPHMGVEAASSLLAAFRLSNATEIESLLVGAGFTEVTVRRVALTTRFPVPGDFIEAQFATSGPSSAMAAMTEDARAALWNDAREAFQAYVDADGLAFETVSHIAVGRA